jgi:hypothetical protein
VNANLGELTLQERVYKPILDVLADHQIKTIGEIEQAISAHNINLAQLIQAILILAGMNVINSVQADAVMQQAKSKTEKLNNALYQKARNHAEISFLASPVTGGGIAVGRFVQLFLLARQQGKQQPTEWAQFVWDVLKAQRQLIIKDGKTLQTEEENLAELNEQAKQFAEKQLVIFQALGIA